MFAVLGESAQLRATLAPIANYFKRPTFIYRTYKKENLRSDLIAGLTVAVIALPAAIAFALIAELPPQVGLYAVIVGGIVGALWGSSEHGQTGPANAISLIVASTLTSVAVPGTDEYVAAAGLLAVMVGAFQIALGVFRLGLLVNFVSHSVIVGFTAGAGLLIIIRQIPTLLALPIDGGNIIDLLQGIVTKLPLLHPITAVLGVGTMLFIFLLRRINPRFPGPLIGMIVASLFVYLFHLNQNGVAVIGELPRGFPPLARLPFFDLELIANLSTGALAIGAIGLVQTIAIVRAIATQTGQRLDSNQEFVGQGMANMAAGLFSGYPVAVSFSRTAAGFKAGARTSLTAVFASLFVLIAMLMLAPLTAYLPKTAVAGILITVVIGLIDIPEIQRIWYGAKGDAIIMLVTLLGTLFLKIEFAVLSGILLSLVLYIVRTSTPRVLPVLPDDRFHHFAYRPDKAPCPQLSIIEIQGDLYFGAVNHVEEFILQYAEHHPEQRFLLLRMHHINHCDFSGIHMLETVVRTYRDRGGDVFMVKVVPQVWQVIVSTGFDRFLGRDHFLEEDEAISHLFYRVLDPAICIYECPVRAFKECQNLPKQIDLVGIPPLHDIPDDRVLEVTAEELWQMMHPKNERPLPYIIDVREPREFRQGHIPEATLIPLGTILSEEIKLPNDRDIILVCRTGRRSRRAAYALQSIGCMNVRILQGGMQAWEAAQLLEAVE